jgi:hypothetical protein
MRDCFCAAIFGVVLLSFDVIRTIKESRTRQLTLMETCDQTDELKRVETWLLTEPTSANFTHCEHSAHGQQCITFACSTQEEELSRNALSCAAIAVVGEVVVERSAFTMAIAKTSVLLTIPDQNSYVWLHRTERTTEVVVKRGRRIRQREFRNCAGRMMITQSMIRWIRKG